VSVTPLQLALAYAAIANGGQLLEPAIVKEIRTSDGGVRFRYSRRVVRRVMPERVAQTLRKLLSGVVERGTAVEAGLATYALGGKTGTPRRTVDGHYAPMQYSPNFVGLFPADAPQLVVVVRLTSPQGNFYGGSTAAPMTKTLLQAALAARGAALDRNALSASSQGNAIQAGRSGTAVATIRRGPVLVARRDTMAGSIVLDLPPGPERRRVAPPRSVPSVRGMTLRDAVRSLHFAGFRVQLARGASSTNVTEPASGAMMSPGSLVRLRYSR
jgi:cell division protein FtsI (penicillin-binding protein 3)